MNYTPQNSTLLIVRKYIRDLLNTFNIMPILNLSIVKEGRSNQDLTNNQDLFIIVDSLEPANLINTQYKYDNVNEQEILINQFDQTITVNFYGNLAYQFATLLIGAITSQNGWDTAKIYNMSVSLVSSIQDLTYIQSKINIPRYELTFKVNSCFETILQTNRIEAINETIITD